MHEIFGLKHMFSTFQETVWSHLNNYLLTESEVFTIKYQTEALL